ncbi:hypothetical protein DPMN_135968 [Dreissena polymorpha]|uniref:Uncharacterized protein n=1 Tax=Dreissena polymorpha TaxID=45954 RepID=A0A9D4JC73_DREPO|nr:hypothetical protein DPMN_135968 [Dreissena polymorpha]
MTDLMNPPSSHLSFKLTPPPPRQQQFLILILVDAQTAIEAETQSGSIHTPNHLC